MPLTLNVGLSRKTSENYNSEGRSINITAELDQSLLARPDELQGAIAELYEQAEIALDGKPVPQRTAPPSQRSNGSSNGHHPNGMTASQRRAIEAIGKRLDLNLQDEARHELGLDLDRMSVRDASRFIDHLKSLQAAGSTSGAGGTSGGRR